MTRQGPKCGARTRAGGTCAQAAGWGTDHPGTARCKLHGGCAPSGRAAGANAAARGQLEALGYLGEVANPLQRLAELAAEADAAKRLLARRVDELSELAADAPGAWFTAWERALDRTAALCAVLSKLDIDARVVAATVAAARQYADEVAWAIDQILDGLGLDARQQALIPELVPRVLRSLHDGKAGPSRPWRPESAARPAEVTGRRDRDVRRPG